MGAFMDIVNTISMMANPTAPVTGAIVQRGVELFAPRAEQKLKTTQFQVVGQGSTYELALADAKNKALNRVAGTFIISSTQTRNTRQTTSTSEYTGGVIRSHDVVDVSETAEGLVMVTIDAVVQQGKKNVVAASNIDPEWQENIGALLEEQQRQQEFAPTLGNQPMYVATITKTLLTARANFAEMKVAYNVVWSPKYVDDIRTYANTAGQLTKIGDARTMYAVCFGTTAGWRPDEQCRDVSAEIPSVDQPLYLKIWKRYKDGSSKYEVVDLRGEQSQLRVVTQPGQRFYHAQSGREVKYQKGVVIFEKGTVNGVINLRVKLEEAARIVSLEAEPFNGQ